MNRIYRALERREHDLESVRQELIHNKNSLDAQIKEWNDKKKALIRLDDRCECCTNEGDERMHHNSNHHNALPCPHCHHHPRSHYADQQQNGMINPLLQMQRLVQQQQIQMLKQEHRFELTEANRRRDEMEKRLKEVLELQKKQLEAPHHHKPHHPPHEHGHHREDREINRLLHALAHDTREKFREMNRVLSELKAQADKPQPPAAPAPLPPEPTASPQTDGSEKILGEIKTILSTQMAQFEKQRQALLNEYNMRDEQRVREFENKERELRNMINEIRTNFNNQLLLMRNDRDRIADKLAQYKAMAESRRVEEARAPRDAKADSEAKSILDETKRILEAERQRYAQERDQILRHNYMNDLAKKNRAKNIQSEKQMQIQKLTDEIKNIKDLLDK